MLLNIIWIGLGLIFLIAVMAFVLNPPEAWVKRAFHGKKKQNRDR
jgi:uncharacterized membrane protein